MQFVANARKRQLERRVNAYYKLLKFRAFGFFYIALGLVHIVPRLADVGWREYFGQLPHEFYVGLFWMLMGAAWLGQCRIISVFKSYIEHLGSSTQAETGQPVV